jgi:hypothetical protein
MVSLSLRHRTFSLKLSTARFSPAFAHRCSFSTCEELGVLVPLGSPSTARAVAAMSPPRVHLSEYCVTQQWLTVL